MVLQFVLCVFELGHSGGFCLFPFSSVNKNFNTVHKIISSKGKRKGK